LRARREVGAREGRGVGDHGNRKERENLERLVGWWVKGIVERVVGWQVMKEGEKRGMTIAFRSSLASLGVL
jgi:hypothetical protein